MRLPVLLASYRVVVALVCATLLGAAGCSEPPSENIDTSVALTKSIEDGSLAGRVTVSGVSAGGYMAVQAHVALADRIGGVAVVAGGPYHCAEGSVTTAIGRCMSGTGLEIDGLVAQVNTLAAAGKIANPDLMKNARVWLFHSPKDAVVAPNVSAGLFDFYRAFVPGEHLRFVNDVEAAHGWPTLDAGSACLQQGGDYINACGFDTAGEFLEFLYDDLGPRSADTEIGELLEINMTPYFASGSGVAEMGYAFVPQSCSASMQECRLHIAFHGCVQGAEYLDKRFAANVGLNEWAVTNRIVMVYPQVESSFMNPKGCWDWWGYTGADYDQISGKQIAGINALIVAFAKQNLFSSNGL